MAKPEVKTTDDNSKQEFLAALAVSSETEVVEGATVRALPDDDCQRVKVLAAHASLETKGEFETRRAAHDLTERAALLHYGVVSPKMPFAEWKHVLKTANTAKIEAIIAAIKAKSGLDEAEVAFAKKVAEQMGTTLSA